MSSCGPAAARSEPATTASWAFTTAYRRRARLLGWSPRRIRGDVDGTAVRSAVIRPPTSCRDSRHLLMRPTACRCHADHVAIALGPLGQAGLSAGSTPARCRSRWSASCRRAPVLHSEPLADAGLAGDGHRGGAGDRHHADTQVTSTSARALRSISAQSTPLPPTIPGPKTCRLLDAGRHLSWDAARWCAAAARGLPRPSAVAALGSTSRVSPSCRRSWWPSHR